MHVCAIRPTSIEVHCAPVVVDDSFSAPEQSPFALDRNGVLDVSGDEDVDAETGDISVRPRALPTPKLPSAAVVAQHNLTHYPYRSWCPWCAAGRRPNSHHMSQPTGRTLPMFHADYCFIRDSEDEKVLTVLVGRMSPSKAFFATVCDSKGPLDLYVLNRLEAFLKDEGVSKIAYRSDQEASIVATIEAALRNSGKAGDITDAAPEHSAVGESASNGTAESAVKQFEDQLRTLKGALEAHMGDRLPVDHAIMRWLVQHVASIFNRHSTNSEGLTPHECRHGRRSHGRTAEFGERLLYYVPKKLRAKLDLRWRVGVFLGTSDRSNEAYIGTRSGNVVKSRGLARVVSESKWDRDSIFRVTGTPMTLCPNIDGNQDADWIESEVNPQAEHFDEDIARDSAEVAEGQSAAPPPPVPKGPLRLRITKHDLSKYGYTTGCRRCNELRAGRIHTKDNHSEECRSRIYSEWEANNDVKWVRAQQELGLNSDHADGPPGNVEIDGLDELGTQRDRSVSRDRSSGSKHKSTAHSNDDHYELDPVDLVEADADVEAFPNGAGAEGAADEAAPIDPPDAEMDDGVDLFFDGDDENEMHDSLILAGVDPDEARLFGATILGRYTGVAKSSDSNNTVFDHELLGALANFSTASDPPTTFVEAFGRGSIIKEAAARRRNLNLKGLHAMDLRTFRSDGTPWDFSKKEHRHDARRMLASEKPDWVIGSPPCTAFSIWNVGINFKKMDPTKVAAMIQEGRSHLQFCAELYRKQLKGGRHFLHEHPATAVSWREPCIDSLMRDPKMFSVVCDQCQFGLTTLSEDRKSRELAMKPTRFLTSSQSMAECLDRRCDRSHKHQHLAGGRAAEAAFYPLPLIRAILKGMRRTSDFEKRKLSAATERAEIVAGFSEFQGNLPLFAAAAPLGNSEITRVNGGKVKIEYRDWNFKPRYTDEYTGEVLDAKLIREALVEELNFFNEKRIWELEDLRVAKSVANAVHVRTRWVLCNKGDAVNPDMRARLVACEVNKTGKEDAFYASTPPGESKKILFSLYASRRHKTMKDGSKMPLRLSFIDIKKAYFNGVPTRDIYMSLPPELGLPKHFVAKQTRCVYGTRDAGMIWEQCYRNALEGMGFTSGISNPCLFHHPSRDISVVVHGDDFTAMATDDDLDWYTAELEKVFEIKVRGRLGEGLEQNEIRILNRIVRVTPQGVRYEADPRHYELLSRSLGLEGASSTLTPGVKPSEVECETFKGDEGEIEGPVMDVTGRICTSTIGDDGRVLISENDGTDTIRQASLEDIMSGKLSEREGKAEKRVTAKLKSNTTGETSVATTSTRQQPNTTGKTSVATVALSSLHSLEPIEGGAKSLEP